MSKHTNGHTMHKNSLESYAAMMAGDMRMTRCGEIYKLLTGEPPLTDRQICARLGYSDMNAVRPRVSEMIDVGILEEVGAVVDTVTGKTVRVVQLNDS